MLNRLVFIRAYALRAAGTATTTTSKYAKPVYTKSTSVYSKLANKPSSPSTTPLGASPENEVDIPVQQSSDRKMKPTATAKTPQSIVDSYPNGNSFGKKLNGISLNDLTKDLGNSSNKEVDWTTSFSGIGSKPFSSAVQDLLAQSLTPGDIEVKPDGLIYLPEIKYRRILNKTFGAGGWGLVPRSETIITDRLLTREYGLICHGQLVGVARGEQDYFSPEGIPTATEGCKSNALMRCCKDLGIGSELWDPVFIKTYKKKYCDEKFVEHVVNKKKKKIWIRKDRDIEYPWK